MRNSVNPARSPRAVSPQPTYVVLAQVLWHQKRAPRHLLYNGDQLRRWSVDDVRAQVRAGHPVIAQVYYARLPGRERVVNGPDHYIVITGVVDDGFLYNDSIDSDGVGWDRVISGDRLYAAMDASDRRFRYAAFAAARAGT